MRIFVELNLKNVFKINLPIDLIVCMCSFFYRECWLLEISKSEIWKKKKIANSRMNEK